MNAPPAGRPTVLAIGGSDPIGAAGTQADLRHLAALGVHGAAVATAFTIQRVDAVISVQAADPDLVRESLETVGETLRPEAVVIGMLGTTAVAQQVVMWLTTKFRGAIVLDPVRRASAGAVLTDDGAFALVREALAVRADLVLPNLEELGELAGAATPGDDDARRRLLAELLDRGSGAVLSKGGHAPGDDAVDLLATASGVERFASPRLSGRFRGAGGALAAACAAYLARGCDVRDAVRHGRAAVRDALERACRLGTPFLHLIDHASP